MSIDLAHLSADSVDSTQYVDGSIDNAHLADDAVDSDELAAGSVDAAHLAAGVGGVSGITDNSNANAITIDSSENVAIDSGNLVISTHGKGIDFSANTDDAGGMTAEILDDYEEGTFTPVFGGTTGTAGDSATTQSLTAHYIKIGALVYWSFGITWTDKGSWTGNVQVTGLPFTCGSAGYPSGAIGYLGGGGDIDTTGYEWFVPRPQPSNSFLALIKHQNGGASQDVTLDNVTLPIFIIASGTYHT